MKRQINYVFITLFLTIFGSCLLRTTNQTNICANGFFKGAEEGCKDAYFGRLYAAQGRLSESARFFHQAAKKLPEFADYFMLAKANAELKNRNFSQAKSIAQALLNSTTALSQATFSSRVNQVLAMVAVAQKDHVQIIKTHEDLLAKGFGEKEALLFNLATSLNHMGEIETANEVYKNLLVFYPASPEAKKTEELISLSNLELTNKENETRFNKLIQSLSFDKIVSESDAKITKLGTSKDAETNSLLNGYAVKSLMLNNQFKQGIERAKKQAHHQNATPKDLETYAWTLGKVNRYQEASDYYSRLMLSAQDPENQAKGCFFAGFSLYEAGYYSMAQFSWQKCHNLIQNSSYYESYLWYQSFGAILNGNFNLAYTKLNEINDTFKNSQQIEKYTYFTAYTLYQMGKKNAGDAIFRELAKKSQPTYYVLQARNFLGLMPVKGLDIQPDALSQLALSTKNADLKKAMTLFHLGFFEDAKEMILSAKAPAAEKIATLQHVGFFHEAWQRSYLLAPNVSQNGSILNASANIRSRYSLPYLSIIKDRSEKYSVRQSLLYAVMQTESGFLKDAQSSRGATGLMQIMPFVAHDLAEKLAIDQFSTNRLKEPEIAIELGALLIANLKRQFEKNHLVVAAYNAGPHQVQKWIDDFGHLPPELFIERIPFEQTRNYAKKVLQDESIYNSLQGEPLRLLL